MKREPSVWGYELTTLSLGDIHKYRDLALQVGGWKQILKKKKTVSKSKVVKTGSILAGTYKEGCGSKSAVLKQSFGLCNILN
jgi:hypothetical protein